MKAKNIFKMALGMVACCLLPIMLIVVLSVLGITAGNRIISFIVPFLCPLMMIGMMFFMGMGMKGDAHKGHSCCGSEMNNDPKENNSDNNVDAKNLEKLQ